jgi:hypothetical protein
MFEYYGGRGNDQAASRMAQYGSSEGLFCNWSSRRKRSLVYATSSKQVKYNVISAVISNSVALKLQGDLCLTFETVVLHGSPRSRGLCLNPVADIRGQDGTGRRSC